MKANKLNTMPLLLEKRGKTIQTIHYKRTSIRTLSFIREEDKKIIGTYTHHPFLDQEGYIYGVFRVTSCCSEHTMLSLIKSYKNYWVKNKLKFLTEILPGFNHLKKPLKGFRFSFWKGENDIFVKALINSGIEIDYISRNQISFKMSAEKDYYFTSFIDSKDKRSINYEDLATAHAVFLERKICVKSQKRDLEKLAAYIENKDPERLDYYKLIHALS